MDVVTVLFWLLAACALFSRLEFAYYLAFVSWSFGTLAVLPAFVGANITPPWVCTAIVVAKVFQRRSGAEIMSIALEPKLFLALTLCTIYGVASALILPNLFVGKIEVILMRLNFDAQGVTFLAFSAANITQSGYFILTTLFTIAIYFTASTLDGRRLLFSAFRWGAITVVVTGLADLLTSSTGLAFLLSPFRNATYAIMVDDSMLGAKRVIGLASEASAYAGLTLSFLGLLVFLPSRPSAIFGAPWFGITLAVSLAAMTYVSTSSGGLVALGVVGILVTANFARGAVLGRQTAVVGLFCILVSITVAVGTILLSPEVSGSVARLVDGMVLQKTHSQSYIERSQWNTVAYNAFLQSYGLGVGLGSARASSWVFAVLSNLGAPGAILLSVFMVQVMFAKAAEQSQRELLLALKLGLIPGMLVPTLSGTSVGYGLGNAFIIGLALALITPLQSLSPRGPHPSRGKTPSSPLLGASLERRLSGPSRPISNSPRQP